MMTEGKKPRKKRVIYGAVVAVRRDGEVAGVFDSVRKAHEVTGIGSTCIYGCLGRYDRVSSHGLQWYPESYYREKWMEHGPSYFTFDPCSIFMARKAHTRSTGRGIPPAEKQPFRKGTRLIDLDTGVTYLSCNDAARRLKYSRTYVHRIIRGLVKHPLVRLAVYTPELAEKTKKKLISEKAKME